LTNSLLSEKFVLHRHHATPEISKPIIEVKCSLIN
jgi:hypothetical protein